MFAQWAIGPVLIIAIIIIQHPDPRLERLTVRLLIVFKKKTNNNRVLPN